MNKDWNSDEIIEEFTLLPSELEVLGNSRSHNRLGKALMLKFFQHEYRFPENASEIPDEIVEYVAQQLRLSKEVLDEYNWEGRSLKEHRKEIRERMDFRPATRNDQKALLTWLVNEALPHEYRAAHLEQLICQRLRREHIEPPTKNRIDRIVVSAISQHEKAFFAETYGRLSATTRANLRQLIHQVAALDEEVDLEERDESTLKQYPIHDLKTGAGEPKVNNIKKVAARLKLLQEVGLPSDLFADVPLPFLQQYQQQVAVESISNLQRRSKNERQEAQLYTMLAAFCWVRQCKITDYLVDLFIRILNDIRLRARSRVEKQLIADYIKVGGKQQLLFQLIQTMWDNPADIIQDVLYPLIGKERLKALVEEAKHQGAYRQSVQTRISGSYTHHYRQILPLLLEVLSFRSNNEQYKPLIEALKIVAAYLEEKDAYYPEDQEVPMDDVIQKQWQNRVQCISEQ